MAERPVALPPVQAKESWSCPFIACSKAAFQPAEVKAVAQAFEAVAISNKKAGTLRFSSYLYGEGE
jgi:hypothetical protein